MYTYIVAAVFSFITVEAYVNTDSTDSSTRIQKAKDEGKVHDYFVVGVRRGRTDIRMHVS